MKLLPYVLSLSIVTLAATASVALADSSSGMCTTASCSPSTPVELTIAKASDTTAKVTANSKSAVVPISFGDGASWDSVKDHYELSAPSEAALASGKAKLSVGSDGTLTWSK